MSKYITTATPSKSRGSKSYRSRQFDIRQQIRDELNQMLENQIKSILKQEVKDQVTSAVSALQNTLIRSAGESFSNNGFELSESQLSNFALNSLKLGL